MGLKTLLIDADLRRPVLHDIFQQTREPGLTNIITATMDNSIKADKLMDFTYEEAQNVSILKDFSTKQHVEQIQISLKAFIISTHVKNLDLLTSGLIPPNPSELLATDMLKNILREVRNRYNAIFIDSPPINVVTDAAILNSIVDGSILVFKAGSSTAKDVQRAKSLLQAQGKILGLVMNYANSVNGYSNYYYYYYDDNNRKKVKARK